MNGSNELNALLKSKVIEVRAVLDIEGSLPNLKLQIDKISEKLENKPVKLKVKLDVTVAELNKQLSTIQNKIDSAKTIKPIRLKVDMDVTGSAKTIKDQLEDAYKTVDDFNKKYSKQLDQMQKVSASPSSTVNQKVPMDGKVNNFNNIMKYNDALAKTEEIMRKKFTTEKENAIFTAKQYKDTEGYLRGYTANLLKANGVMEQLNYSWNQNANEGKGAFVVVDRTTADNIQKYGKQAQDSLSKLDTRIKDLGNSGKELRREFMQLSDMKYSLHPEAIKDFENRIKAQERENKLLLERKKLAQDIIKSSTNTKEIPRREDYVNLSHQARSASDLNTLKQIRSEMDQMVSEDKLLKANEAEKLRMTKERLKLIREIKIMEAKAPHDLVRDALTRQRLLVDEARTLKDIQRISENISQVKNINLFEKDQDKARKMLKDLEALEGQLKAYSKNMGNYHNDLSRLKLGEDIDGRNFLNLTQIEKSFDEYHRMLKDAKSKNRIAEKQIRLGEDITSVFGQKNAQELSGQLFKSGGVDQQSIDSIKRYIGEINKAKVASVSFGRDSIDTLGNKIKTFTTTLAGTGSHVKRTTYSVVEGTNEIRKLNDEMVRNSLQNLGIMEQLRVAVSRVPVWMVAMTAFYGSIASVRAMVTEIIEIDKLMTNIARVTGDQINLDSLFQGAVGLSHELGNNLHDILGAVGEFSRTFGEFNERQLLAITKTAILASNVSELTAQESAESLIGTMNAFNMEAEESIRIVDAMNEVDNKYAISTKQIADGMSKSASVARTFGVTMEENIGNITAIGSVTMESGKIIGNSLKTMYSRITTMADAEEVLNGVGISIRKIGENGEETVRPVTQIMSDLASQWFQLTEAEQQNIAVKLAGREHLSRFLAWMNNYHIAIDSTITAENSHGSAMRENAKYMQSFEARLNKLKNAFSTFALAVGDAFLSDAMLLVIEGLSDIAKGASEVTKHIGVLPALFLGLVGVLGMMKVEVFTSMFSGIQNGLTTVQGFFDGTRKEAIKADKAIGQAGSSVGRFGTQTTASMAVASTAVKGFGVTWKAVMAGTIIGAGAVALGIIFETVAKKWAEAKQNAEDLKKMQEGMVSAYRTSGDGLEGLIETYENADKSSTEYADAVASLANLLPTSVKYIDANGQAHLKSADDIRVARDAVKELSMAQAELARVEFNEDMIKNMESYAKVAEKVAKINDEIKKKQAEDGTIKVEYDTLSDFGNNTFKVQVDNAKELAELEVERIKLEAQRTEEVQKTSKAIQDQAFYYLEASEKSQYLTEAQREAMEMIVSTNEEILRSQNMSEESQQKLLLASQAVGEVLADNTEKLTSQYKDDPLQLEKITGQIDQLVRSVPEDFFELDKNNTISDVRNNLEDLLSVTNMLNSGATFDQLKAEFIDLGWGSEEATALVGNLAKEQKNSQLLAEAQADGYDEVAESLDAINQAMKEAIDLNKVLFGYNSTELTSMESRFQLIKAQMDLHGESALQFQNVKDALFDLADNLNVTEKELIENFDAWWGMIDILQEVDLSQLEVGVSIQELINANENLTQAEKDKAIAFLEGQVGLDAITGKTKEAKEETDELGNSIDETGKKVDGSNEKKAFTGTKTGAEEAGVAVDGTKSRVDELNAKVSGNDGHKSYYGLKQGADEAGTAVDGAKEKVNDLGGAILEADSSYAFDDVKTGAEEAKGKVDETKASVDTLKTTVSSWDVEGAKAYYGFSQATDASTGKVNDLTLAIQNAVSGATALDGLDQKVSNSNTHLETMATNITNIGNAFAGFNSGAEVIAVVKESILDISLRAGEASTSVLTMNDFLARTGTDFNGITIVGTLNNIGINALDASGRVALLNGALTNISDKAGPVSSLASAMQLLADKLIVAHKTSQDVATVQSAVVTAFQTVIELAQTYTTNIQLAGITVSQAFVTMVNTVRQSANEMLIQNSRMIQSNDNMSTAILEEMRSIIRAYNTMLNGLEHTRDTVHADTTQIVVSFNRMARLISEAMVRVNTTMSSQMMAGANTLVAIARDLPRRIGQGIRDNMASATNAMDALAKNMVKRFKAELGIHSPSRVFTGLGGDVISGLVNGLSGGNLKSLGKEVFSGFGGGIYDSWDAIKNYVQFGDVMGNFSELDGMATGGVFSHLRKTSGYGMRTLNGQPNMHNGVDFAGPKGSPTYAVTGGRVIFAGWGSKGSGYGGLGNVVAVRDSSGTDHLYGHHSSNHVRVGQTVKAKQRVGSVGDTGYSFGNHLHYARRRNGRYIHPGYAKGGIVNKMELAWHGEEGAEAIIPLISKRRKRGLELWEETGQRLGVDPAMIELLKKRFGKKQDNGEINNSSDMGHGHALSGEGSSGTTSSGGTGSSGIMQPSFDSSGNFLISALAGATAGEPLADLYKSNPREREIAKWESYISIVEAKMKNINKESAQYGKYMQEIISYEYQRLRYMKQDQAVLEKRNVTIQAELKKLPTKNQTPAQRDTYNKLAQELEQNQDKILQYRTEIEGVLNSINETSQEHFKGTTDRILSTFVTGLDTIQSRLDDLDFKKQHLELTDPEDENRMIQLIQQQITALKTQERQQLGLQASLQKRIKDATLKYGANSDIVKGMIEELNTVKDTWKSTTLEILKAEQEVLEQRAEQIEEILERFEDKVKTVTDRISNISFKMEVLELTDPDNEGAMLSLIQQEINELRTQKSLYSTFMASLQAKIREATRSYGSDSDIVKNLVEEYNTIQKSWQDTTLEIYRAENRIRDMKADVADQIIDKIKKHYEEAKDIALKANDKEQEALEKSHKAKMDRYDDQIEKVNEVYDNEMDRIGKIYDAKLKALDDEADQEDFQGELNTRNSNISRLRNEVSVRQFDTSLEGKKKYAELQEELKEAQADLDKFLRDREREQTRDALTEQQQQQEEQLTDRRDQQIDTLEKAKEHQQQLYDAMKERLDKESQMITEHYDRRINDEQRWTNIRDDLIRGNYSTVRQELAGMGIHLEQLSNGTFNTLSANFLKYSTDIQMLVRQINDDINEINRSTGKYEGAPVLPPTVSERSSTGYQINEILRKSKSGQNLDVPTPEKNRLYQLMKNFKGADITLDELVRKALAGIKLDKPNKEKNDIYDLIRKMIGFESGGFTGDWQGDEGRVAMLHKKELVLERKDTTNLLDAVKMVNKVKEFIPQIERTFTARDFNTAGMNITNNYDLTLNIQSLNGTREGGKAVFKEIVTGLKKMGKG